MISSAHLRALARRLGRRRSSQPYSTRRDRSIARRLYTAFEHDLDLPDAQRIHFYVYKGNVTLYGSIRHQRDADVVASVIREMPGVRGVSVHLQGQDAAKPPFSAEPAGTSGP